MTGHALPVDTGERLKELRALMKRELVQAYLVPSDDMHSSEYVAACDERRQWISGFTGSAGTALILEEEALLFTDGRYHQQAAKELCKDWTLQKYGLPDVKNWQEYLPTLPPSVTSIGIDPTLLSISDFQSISPTLPSSASIKPVAKNLIDELWLDRPKRPKEEVFMLGTEYAGAAVTDKLVEVRKELVAKKAAGILLSMLDEVAWLFNLRGSDIPFNPVFFAHAYVPLHGAPTLFIDLDQLTSSAYDHLMKAEILIEPYDSVIDFLQGVGTALGEKDVVVVPARTSLALCDALGTSRITVCRSPIGDLKAVKNAVETKGFRQCHIRDGVALTRFFSWLERELLAGASISESAAASKLEELRKELPLFRGLSFPTISSTGANASVIHYQPDAHNSAIIDKDKVYLCDSGAQYFDGTTDTTRTLHFGTPTDQEVRAATRVLQGHIAIDRLVFPTTTTGFMIDVFARRALWQDGLDYRHGTGHGVGSFLNVHEGPHGIGTRIGYNEVKLKAGFTVSNEPGFYLDGSFGIRIENVLVVQQAIPPNDFGGVGWLKFEHFTMVPITTKLVDATLLSPDERAWLNDYNLEVRRALLELVKATGDQAAVKYLIRETAPL